MPYDLEPIHAPRAAGGLLKRLVSLVENPVTGGLLAKKLLTDVGIMELRSMPAQGPATLLPPVFEKAAGAESDGGPESISHMVEAEADASRGPGFSFTSAVELRRAYLDGKVDPVAVADAVIEHIRETEKASMAIFIAYDPDLIMEQARASAERYAKGEPLGPLDGIPVAVKDELDLAPYPTTVGTRFLGKAPAEGDATAVARLRAQGAVLLGKVNMHEMGLGVTGMNTVYGPARNPYDPARHTGGSSSGSAAAVAAGLCPVAVGADAGGSIRIPSALCGVVGLKPTFGRVSEHGAASLVWSIAHVGPIGGTVEDVAVAYGAMAGPDRNDSLSTLQPRVRLPSLERQDLAGLTFGVYWPWFEDAEPRIVASCKAALEIIQERGGKIREIEIPDLKLLRAVHLVTVVSEMAGAHLSLYRAHRKEYGLDTRMNLALARILKAYDYIHAARHRTRICANFDAALSEVDVILTPTTGVTAPIIPSDALETGESNLELTGQIMRFVAGPNLTGYPALTMPVGYDDRGLPVGLQLMGRAWEEHLLLEVAAVLERSVERRAPRVHYRHELGD